MQCVDFHSYMFIVEIGPFFLNVKKIQIHHYKHLLFIFCRFYGGIMVKLGTTVNDKLQV